MFSQHESEHVKKGVWHGHHLRFSMTMRLGRFEAWLCQCVTRSLPAHTDTLRLNPRWQWKTCGSGSFCNRYIYIYMIIIIISKWIIFESKTRLLSAFPWKTHGSTCPRSAPRLCGPRGYGSSSRTRRTRSSHHHWYPPPNWPNAKDENQWLTNSPVVTHQLERKQPWLKLENNRPKRLAEFGRSSEHPFSYEIAPRLCWDRLTSLWSGQFGGLKEAIDNIR